MMAPVAAAVGGPIGLTLLAGGTALSALGQMQQGNQAARMAEYQAKLQERQALAHRAEASQEAAEDIREGELLASRAQAVGAASGGGVDDALLANLRSEANLNARMAIWDGEEKSKGALRDAGVSRFEGASRKKASRMAALGTIASSASSMYMKYGPKAGAA